MRVVFLLSLFVSFSFAGWVFVNDDGTFSPYGESEVYSIPQEVEVEIVKPKVIKKRVVRKKRKPVAVKKEYYHDSYSGGLKTMYLTFDDGPLAGSANIISVLQEEAVPATMFMVGKHIHGSSARRSVYQRAIDEPTILVANHTYSHANGRYRHFYSDESRVVDDIFRMDAMLSRDDIMHGTRYTRLAGRNVFRIPGFSKNDLAIKRKYGERSKYDALYEAGFYIYGWDYQWSYNPKSGRVNQSPESLAKRIEHIYQKGKTRRANKFILLMHDFSFKDRLGGKRTLTNLIRILREKGWQFETLETYF